MQAFVFVTEKCPMFQAMHSLIANVPNFVTGGSSPRCFSVLLEMQNHMFNRFRTLASQKKAFLAGLLSSQTSFRGEAEMSCGYVLKKKKKKTPE